MEQLLERQFEAQNEKKSLYTRRGMELNNLRPHQQSQELKPIGGGMRPHTRLNRLRGCGYTDYQFGYINQPMPETPAQVLGVAPTVQPIVGSGNSNRREMIRTLMKTKGMTLPEASHYIKANKL